MLELLLLPLLLPLLQLPEAKASLYQILKARIGSQSILGAYLKSSVNKGRREHQLSALLTNHGGVELSASPAQKTSSGIWIPANANFLNQARSSIGTSTGS